MFINLSSMKANSEAYIVQRRRLRGEIAYAAANAEIDIFFTLE